MISVRFRSVLAVILVAVGATACTQPDPNPAVKFSGDKESAVPVTSTTAAPTTTVTTTTMYYSGSGASVQTTTTAAGA